MENWFYARFLLVVTGIGEEKFLPDLFSQLTASNICRFDVLERIGQLNPITSVSRRLKIVGTNRSASTREDDLGLRIRGRLALDTHAYVLIVDDLEHERRPQCDAVYSRYRDILDRFLDESDRTRASVHFLVNMLESYYFAHPDAVTTALNLVRPFPGESGDVEEIRNPKSNLRQILNSSYKRSFDEVSDGKRIVNHLRLEIILGDAQTCAALRTLVAWCVEKLESHPQYTALNWSKLFHLESGVLFSPTRKQLRSRSE
jgi:hypothetical protein